MPPPHLRLPPPDLDRSPHTGWTRAHWEATADQLLAAVRPYASPRGAQYRLPGRASVSGPASDALEGYARTFLLAAFRIAGARGVVDPALIERYAAGLDAGTDPASGEAWPPIADRYQAMVEAASIAIGLHETRPWLWDRLDGAVQERVAHWLGGFIGAVPHDNNWRLFQVVAEQFLASVGAPYAQEDIDGGLERIEDWYVQDGWYSDGTGKNFDYYIGWAMHLYPLLWSRIADASPDGGGGRAELYRERLRGFLTTYPHFFGADGGPVHQGRSLVYRFAAAAPVWLGALAGCTPLAPGLTRRLASGALRHFAERGAPDERGLLTLGWYEPFLPMTQSYSGPASPYWASKGFAGLLLPPDHPVWTERERPLPVEVSDFAVPLAAPGWLLHGTRHDGVVRLLNHGTDHLPPGDSPDRPDDPHYAKLAYSTATAPETAQRAWRRTVDGHLALLAADGTASRRHVIHPLGVSADRAASWYEARLPGADDGFRIETTSLVYGPWEVRVHRLEAPRGATVREGGHAVAGPARPTARTGSGWALTRGAGELTSAVVGLHGWDETGGVAREVEANAFGPHSATPYLLRRDHPGGSTLHVTLVALTRSAVHPQALREAVVVTPGADGEASIRFPDGTTLRA